MRDPAGATWAPARSHLGYFGSCPGCGSASGKACAPAGAGWLPEFTPVTAEGLAFADGVPGTGAADAVRWAVSLLVLLATAARKRRADSSSVVTLPAMMSP